MLSINKALISPYIILFSVVLLHSLVMESQSTMYSLTPDYKISLQQSYSQLAHAYFREQAFSTGWHQLHIYANPEVSLMDQHQAAGYLQGYATYRQIYSAWKNLMKGIIKGPRLSQGAENFVNQQWDFIEQLTDNHGNQLFRIYAKAYMEQLRYMHRGYLARINEENQLGLYLGFTEFYYLTNVGDLEDIVPAFLNETEKVDKSNFNYEKLGNCNSMSKLLNGQLFVGHSTHNIYEFLLRIYKTYSFPSRDPRVGSQWFSFASRPGDLISKDDFYILSNGMIVMQTSFTNNNEKNYETLSPKTIPSWLRQCVAVNLARDNNQWADYFLKYRSGTHNNQWTIINAHKLRMSKDIVMFVEEAFDIYTVADMTERFLKDGYIASYNMPFDKMIQQKLNITGGSYDDVFRAYEYKKYNPLIQNEEDMKKYLLMNENDDPTMGIAPRYDLAAKNPRPFGLTDLKIVSSRTAKENYVWAYSGPTTSNGRFQPFDWGKWEQYGHQGMPKVWNFTFERIPFDYELELNKTTTKLQLESRQEQQE